MIIMMITVCGDEEDGDYNDIGNDDNDKHDGKETMVMIKIGRASCRERV